MINASDKYDYYNQLKRILNSKGFTVNPYRDIDYGIQFLVFLDDDDALVRVYQSKKGIKLDLSQVKNDSIKSVLDEFAEPAKPKPVTISSPTHAFQDDEDSISEKPDTDPAELIGVDESGKGDYFGPLCVAAVHTDAKKSIQLKKWGVMDSKKITDDKILELAPKIRSLCHHNVITMGNESYNEIYEQFQNLNHILAWGHAKSMEGVLEQVDCPYALSDQFGRKSLVENAIRSKGLKLKLFQRHKAEDNVAVAAASILAREAYLTHMDKIENSFQMRFPKGCSKNTLKSAIIFAQKIGREQLPIVAKMHFVVTKHVDEFLNR
jgi:ribonuclease HIII